MTDQTGRLRVSLRIAFCTLLCGALTYACAGSDAPTGQNDRGIHVLAGAEQTDTALAILRQALVVEVRDQAGLLAKGRTVQFKALSDWPAPYVVVAAVDSLRTNSETSIVTDGRGRAVVVVLLGATAGTARLAITVPELGLSDTVSYTVIAASPTKLTISPHDTAMLPNTSFTLNAAVTDWWGNPVPGAVPTFSATGVTASATGQIAAASALLRGQIVVSYQALTDTAKVSVVPLLPMVINKDGGVVLVNSDGTGWTTLATSTDNSIAPSSVLATPSVAYYTGNPGGDARVWLVQRNGTPRALVSGETRSESWPRLSPDGTWVYFMRDWGTLWRVHLDGTGLDSLATYSPPQGYAAPAIAPDGKSVALQSGNGLKIVDVATKVSRTLSVACGFPSYSPDGAWFACASASDISVMKTDGTSRRVVVAFPANNGPSYLSGLDWTPDGKWLLAMTGNATLYDVATGATLPLTGFRGNGSFMQATFVR